MTEPKRVLVLGNPDEGVEPPSALSETSEFEIELAHDRVDVHNQLSRNNIECVLTSVEGAESETMAAVADYPDTPVLLLMNPGPKPVVVELSDPLDIERGPDVPAQKTVLSHQVELAMTDEQTARNRSAPDTSTIYERITDGFFAVDRDWEYTYVNSEGAALTDRPRAELIGTRVWDAFPELVDTPFEDALRRAMDSGETTEVEAHYQPHGIWYDVRAYPDDNGISIYFRDITQRVARRKKLERENERLEQFANIISHDLRNPLAVAQGNVELVKDEHGTTDELETVSRALDRMEALIDDMLALARQEQGIKETDSISLPEIAEDCWTTIESADATLEVVSGYAMYTYCELLVFVPMPRVD